MNEKLIRAWVREILKEDVDQFTVAGEVIDLPQNGNEFGVIPGMELSKSQKQQLGRLSAKAFTEFEASRTGVGDIFEDIVAELYGGLNLNLPAGKDYPFADVRIGNAYYSVKGSKNPKRDSGAAGSPIKVATLVSMIDEYGTSGGMTAGVIMTVKGAKNGNVTQFKLAKSDTAEINIDRRDDASDTTNYVGLTIEASEDPFTVWFSRDKSGKGSWKPIDPDSNIFATGGDLEDVSNPSSISATGATQSSQGWRWNNPDQLSNVFSNFSDEKSIYLYNDLGSTEAADLRRADVTLDPRTREGDPNQPEFIPGSQSDRDARRQGSSDVKTGIRRRAAKELQDLKSATEEAKKEFDRVKKMHPKDSQEYKRAKAALNKARDEEDEHVELQIVDHLLREFIREALLTEAFTKTDEKAIEVMARKQIDKKWKEHEKKIDKMFDERDKTLFRNDAFYKVIARIYQELQRAYAEDQFKYATRYTRKDIPLARFRPS